MTPSLAAPLSKALDEAFNAVDDEWTTAELAELAVEALRSDPDVLRAMAEAIRITAGDGVTTFEYRAERLLDALFGTLGAGPIASGEAAG